MNCHSEAYVPGQFRQRRAFLPELASIKKGDPNGSPLCYHAALRLRMGTADSDEMRNIVGGGWKRTGLSKRVLKSRTGRFIMTTAAHSLMRITRHSHRDDDGIPFAASFIPLHGTGRADDSADELHDEPADSETGGRDYWLDQEGNHR